MLFVDTGKLFSETLRYRDRLSERLGLTDVRTIGPDPRRAAADDPHALLWLENPDRCCAMRKVEPLLGALDGFAAWVSGRKRYQGGTRAALPLFERDAHGRIKVNPLAGWPRDRIEREFRVRDLPRHPLEAEGYASIGCVTCTDRVFPGEAPRAGRWRGRAKTECGIHSFRFHTETPPQVGEVPLMLGSVINPLYTASGFLVGILVGLTGVGGGSLMTPALVLLFGLDPRTAVGTDLLYAALTKAAGSAVHHASGTVNWRITGLLAAGSLPASLLTVTVLYLVGPANAHLTALTTAVLGVALIVTAVCVFARPLFLQVLAAVVPATVFEHRRSATIVVGVLLGVLVSISSVGAGAIGMTALVFLYADEPVVRLVGSDIAHAVPLTLVAGLGHLLLGSIDGVVLLSLLIGSVPGIMLGSKLASRVPEFVLRPALAVTLVLVGIRMLG